MTKGKKEFWSKYTLSASKVKRILEKQGVNIAGFQHDYETERDRSYYNYKPRKVSQTQIDAVEAFQQDGDFEALRRALHQNSAIATSTVRRVIQHKAEKVK